MIYPPPDRYNPTHKHLSASLGSPDAPNHHHLPDTAASHKPTPTSSLHLNPTLVTSLQKTSDAIKNLAELMLGHPVKPMWEFNLPPLKPKLSSLPPKTIHSLLYDPESYDPAPGLAPLSNLVHTTHYPSIYATSSKPDFSLFQSQPPKPFSDSCLSAALQQSTLSTLVPKPVYASTAHKSKGLPLHYLPHQQQIPKEHILGLSYGMSSTKLKELYPDDYTVSPSPFWYDHLLAMQKKMIDKAILTPSKPLVIPKDPWPGDLEWKGWKLVEFGSSSFLDTDLAALESHYMTSPKLEKITTVKPSDPYHYYGTVTGRTSSVPEYRRYEKIGVLAESRTQLLDYVNCEASYGRLRYWNHMRGDALWIDPDSGQRYHLVACTASMYNFRGFRLEELVVVGQPHPRAIMDARDRLRDPYRPIRRPPPPATLEDFLV